MKKYLIFLLIPILFACEPAKPKLNPEVEALKIENQKLMSQAQQKDSAYSQLFESLNQIEQNLSLIRNKQKMIQESTRTGVEMKSDVRQRIAENIKGINDLMARNRGMVNSLNKKMKGLNIEIEGFKQSVASLTETVTQKETEIADLKVRLTAMNFTVETLNARIDTLKNINQEKDVKIAGQIETMHTAYYVIGTAKELTKQGVLTQSGGFIGIGKSTKIKSTLNNDYFTKVDITKLNEITLGAKKAKLLTVHPLDSYRLEGTKKGVDKLVITDPEKFWKGSKYLVIVLN
jgi:predicted RNase H-like nuclease (RuvC/YqgF family)